eukprot:5491542-Pleurochrysis_carterae.AAC.3
MSEKNDANELLTPSNQSEENEANLAKHFPTPKEVKASGSKSTPRPFAAPAPSHRVGWNKQGARSRGCARPHIFVVVVTFGFSLLGVLRLRGETASLDSGGEVERRRRRTKCGSERRMEEKASMKEVLKREGDGGEG